MSEEAFYLAPAFWVALSFVVFLGLTLRPICRFIAGKLDARSDQIAHELASARKLREEAETLLASYRQKQKEALKEAENMLAFTQQEATRLAEQAGADLKESLDKRMKLAHERIAQAERKAVHEVQNHVVDIAIAAARTLIQEHLTRTSNEDLIRQAAGELERKLH